MLQHPMTIRPTVDDHVQVLDGPRRGATGTVTRETSREGVVLFEVKIDEDVHWIPEPWLAVMPGEG